MNIKPIKTIEMFDYVQNKNVNVRTFTIEDLSLDIPESTVHAAFALRFNNDKKDGYYVEIGSSHWKQNNNTYMLEKYFNWKGVGIDIIEDAAKDYNKNRSNECVYADATSFNWDKYFEDNLFPKQIDFLQIDIDKTPDFANLLALINLPLSRYRFNTISIEHCYNHDIRISKVRDMQREILFAYGYELVAGGFNEDLWIDKALGMNASEYLSITGETWKGNFI
jgi:hypothetical protein